jgi:UDP-GlcNAc:undecaprenyl-phosphate GlcNAc-1-phosphate transferase
MKLAIPFLTSFMISAALTPLVIKLAMACKCLDLPGGRHLHKRTTPRWGGVAFFAGVLPFLLRENGNGSLTSYIVAAVLLVGMGMLDDLTSLGWKMKFSVMATAATIVIFGGNMTVQQIGTYGPLGPLELGVLSIPFTYLSIIGITNAINLLDGLDGLAGGVSLLGFLFMGFAALMAGNMPVAVICFAFVGALGGFLLYNFPNAKIFMGDTGSLFLGFSLALTAVSLTQGATSSVHSMFPVLVLLLPIFDTLRVLIVRVVNGTNPFKADQLHLHFLVLQMNGSPLKVTLLFWAVTALFGSIALVLTSTRTESYPLFVLLASLLLNLFAVSLSRKQLPITQEINQAELPENSIGRSAPVNLAMAKSSFSSNLEVTTLKWMVVLAVVLLAA